MTSEKLDVLPDKVAAPPVENHLPGKPVVPRPMRLKDIPDVIRSMELAFAADPFQHWIRDTPDFNGRPLYYQLRRAELYMVFTRFVAKGWGFTVDDRGAAVGYFPAKKTWSIIDKGTSLALGGVLKFRYTFVCTKQQKERGMEVERRSKQILKDALGDRKDDMVYLHILCTRPDKQGQGYGSALVKEVTKIADEQRRATFLISSNIANTAFYNSCGFVEVARMVFGENDPTWTEEPVIVPLMVREVPNTVRGTRS